MGKTSQLQYSETCIASASKYGMLRSTADKSVWLYAEIPWSTPLTDGSNDRKRMEAAQQFSNFFDGLAGMVTVSAMKYRSINAGQYREFHILGGAMPVAYRTTALNRGTELGEWQNDMYAGYRTQKQCAYVGVRLQPGGGMFGKGERLDPIAKALYGLDNLAYNIKEGVPRFEEFEPDMRRVATIMESAGFRPFCDMPQGEVARHVSMMKSWWVSEGSGDALPVLSDGDHLHLFPDTMTAGDAKKAYDNKIPCSQWNITGEFPATVCSVKGDTFAQTPVSAAGSQWLAKLLQVFPTGANAVGVSIRGKVEPSAITADQIRRNKTAIEDAIRDRAKHEREATGEMMDMRERLAYKQEIYRMPDMPPTLIELSVTALVAGTKQDALDALGVIPCVEFVAMNTPAEQLFGFQSMMPCSDKRLAPFELEWSCTCVAGAGINSFDKAGDLSGALLGFGEKNRQPVYLGTTVAQDQDRAPALGIVGGTGSGKTMALLSLCFQWARIVTKDGVHTPVIIIDPKEDSDFSDPVERRGGTVISVDSDLSDGEFDPCRVKPSLEEAKECASTMLANIFFPDGDAKTESDITAMLDYGLKHGAKCCGTALRMAKDAYLEAKRKGVQMRTLDESVLDAWRLLDKNLQTNQFLRLIIGTRDDVEPLKASEGLTLIKAGARSLVPTEGSENTVNGRIQRWALRMIVMGAGSSVRNRDGVVALDEAWVALGEGGSVIAQWMRLARSQRFFPVLASQKVQEFHDAGLEGGFSRVLILSMEDVDESNGTVSPAKSTLRLFKMTDDDPQILHRMSIKPVMENGQPNWQSLQRLREPVDPRHPEGKERTIRGSVAYFKDGSNAPVPVEVTIPAPVLAEISTNAKDSDLRKARQAEKAAGRK